MKRILLIFIFFIVQMFIVTAKADVVPMNTTSIKYYGIGVVNMPSEYSVYEQPDKNSPIIKHVNYEMLRKSAIVRTNAEKKVSYIVSVPSKNLALLAVDTFDDNNWYCVFINQRTGETGWIYNENKSDFMTYKDLFYKYGKPYGVRFFNDLTKEEKVLHASESSDSKVLEELTYPTFANFTVIRGNWILTTVNDMTKQAKVGWFNWRNEDGTLNMFPNFKEQ